jgi:DNA-binding IclR family transcriptional regulator
MVNVDLYSDERALDAASVATEAQPDIQAVGRAAQILNLFSNETPELTVGSVAQRLGLNRTTAHRYLSSLVAAGLVRNSESGHTLVPGELAVQLGAFALARRFVLDLASGPMSELSESARMTVVLSIWGRSGPVVAQVHENRSHAVVITVPVGTQLSLDTAQSVLYMANSKDQLAIRRLLASLPSATEREIAGRIQAAATSGLAMKSFDDGITSIAAPVFGTNGISATIALVHTTAMLPSNPDSVEVGRLREVARDLSLQLSGMVTS